MVKDAVVTCSMGELKKSRAKVSGSSDAFVSSCRFYFEAKGEKSFLLNRGGKKKIRTLSLQGTSGASNLSFN